MQILKVITYSLGINFLEWWIFLVFLQKTKKIHHSKKLIPKLEAIIFNICTFFYLLFAIKKLTNE